MLRKSALVLGIALVVIGLAGVSMYMAGVVDIIIEQPADRSWLFWGFAFVAFGIISLGSGVGLLIVWRNLGRQEKTESDEPSISR